MDEHQFSNLQNHEPNYWGEKTSLDQAIKENIHLSHEILEQTRKIKNYMRLRTIISIVWIVIIVAPLIIAIFWLPPIVTDFLNQFQGVISGGQSMADLLQQLNKLKQ